MSTLNLSAVMTDLAAAVQTVLAKRCGARSRSRRQLTILRLVSITPA